MGSHNYFYKEIAQNDDDRGSHNYFYKYIAQIDDDKDSPSLYLMIRAMMKKAINNLVQISYYHFNLCYPNKNWVLLKE